MESVRDSFRLAKGSPSLPERVAEKINAILQGYACFGDRPATGKGRRFAKRHQVGAQRGNATPPPRARAHPASSEPPSSDRIVRASLNKLTGSNYTSISRRVIFIASSDNVAFIIRTGLEKAYLEPNHSPLYVRLFKDVLDSVDSSTRAVALAVFVSELPTDVAMMAEVLLPTTDPVNRYDEFCATCKIRRRIVGRSATFCGLLQVPSIADHLGATPADVYHTHERVLRTLLVHTGGDLDSHGAIEVILESIGAIICRHSNSLISFRAVIKEIPVDSFPTSKCRFKVLDILGKKQRSPM